MYIVVDERQIVTAGYVASFNREGVPSLGQRIYPAQDRLACRVAPIDVRRDRWREGVHSAGGPAGRLEHRDGAIAGVQDGQGRQAGGEQGAGRDQRRSHQGMLREREVQRHNRSGRYTTQP